MTLHNSNAIAITLGQPRFESAELTQLALHSGSETAWLLALTQKDPEQVLQAVSGDFAVALRTFEGDTFLAVDRFAQHTLCYRIVGGELLFSISAKSLVSNESEIDVQAIYDYLYFHCIPSPRTIYRDVFRLPPGHYAWFSQGKLTVRSYWTAPFNEAENLDFKTSKDVFLQTLQDSVGRQLDGSKPACFLSGGTDSSTVAGMAARISGHTVDGYSIGFDAEGYDEMTYARLAAKHFGVRHHEYYVTPADLVNGIPAMAAYMDQPFGNSSILPAYYCAKVARADGASRLLAGDGGDELYGGNSRYAKQRLFDHYQNVPRFIQRGLLEPALLRSLLGKTPLFRKAASYVEQSSMPMPDRLQLTNLITRVGAAQVLTPQMLARLDLTAPLAHQREVWNAACSSCSSLNRELAFDWRYTLAESDLPKVRAATGLADIAVGFPMLDDALLNLSLSLPTDYKLKGQQLRWFFKEALRGFLPDAILTKKKQGFGLPFGVWTTRDASLKALARDSVEGLVSRGIVRAEFSRRLFEVQLNEHPGYYGEMIWILMMLEQWLRAHAPKFRV